MIQIHEAQLDNGELLKTLLQTLTPEEIRTQFGERAADPQLSLDNRVKQLRKKLARLAEAHRAELFDSRYTQLQGVADAPVQQLKQTAPGLPTNVITHLLGQASAQELTELNAQRTPPRLADLARDVVNELRINRAYEGQYLATMPNLDSERLSLNALRIQPGWSANLRIEARHLSAHGEVWLTIGAEDAPLLRTLVRTAEGRYVPHDEKGPLSGETDLYTAILNAMPDAQRDALGFGVNQGPALHERLRQRALPREELRQVLDDTAIAPPTRQTLTALGSDAGYPAQPAQAAPPLTLEDRARAMYPGFSRLQIEELLNHLNAQPDGAANGLAALAEEYRQLESDLRTWRRQRPARHPETFAELSEGERLDERQNRRMIASQLRRCWRRELEIDDYFEDPATNGYSLHLNYPILGALPDLTANFDHVSLLTLSGNARAPEALAFLQRFRRLRHLSVNGIHFGTAPDFIFNLPRLNALSLSGCNIRLTPESQARIASLQHLQSLVLHDNPLGLAPSVEAMRGLIHLDLSHTMIEQLPAGVLTRPELQGALLNDNRIHELPPEFFALPPSKGDGFYLSNNPLSRATVEQVKAYYQRHGIRFGADAFHTDLRDAHQLYPSLGEVELNQLLYNLPGTLEAGQTELASRAAELQTLRAQLTQWEQTPDLSPSEFERRGKLRRLLESSWRQEVTPGSSDRLSLTINRELAGELPTLQASFPHLNGLRIRGQNMPITVDGFLGSFPNLKAIGLHQARLGDIPPRIFSLPKLQLLDLEHCGIRLSPSSRTSLERLSSLRHLNLSNNALGEPLDVSQLTNLTTLNLRNTGLNAVPPSLLVEQTRLHINLSANAIEQLPPELFTLPNHVAQTFDLSANPLSRQALEEVKRHCQRTDVFFNIQTSTAQRERARRLYPKIRAKEEEQVEELNRLIFGLPGNMDEIDASLGALETDYQQLVADLQRWVDDIPAQHPLVGGPLEDFLRVDEELNRRRVKRRLEAAWRREGPTDEDNLDERTTYAIRLKVPIIGTLPELRPRFDHVTSFDLIGAFTLTELDGTLNAFPALQTLIVSNCTLGKLPSAIFNMPNLSSLDLSDCEIVLTPAAARSISGLHTLDYLSLRNNPLGHAPDVSNLQQLSSLHLPNTQIRELPAGVFLLDELRTLDLSDNRITEMSTDLLDMHQTLDDDCDFTGNPWSQESLRRLREYYLQTGNDFQIPEVRLNGAGAPLVPLPDEPMEE